MKLVVSEPESMALIEFLRAQPDRVSSTVALTEVPRALGRGGFGHRERRRARALLARVALVEMDRRILTAAATLDPPSLRSLDAIHLATALAIRDDVTALVTYDRRLHAAAEDAHLDVVVPA